MSPLPSFMRSGAAGEELAKNPSRFLKIESGQVIEFAALTGMEPPDGEEPTGKNSVISFRQYTLWLDEADRADGAMSPTFVATGEPDDPGALLGLESKFRALMLVLPTGETQAQILPMSVSVFKQLAELESMLGTSIKGQVLRYSKTGEGLRTRYRIVATGRTIDVKGEPDIDLVDHVGFTDRGKIIEMLEKVGAWPPPDGSESIRFEETGKSRRLKGSR